MLLFHNFSGTQQLAPQTDIIALIAFPIPITRASIYKVGVFVVVVYFLFNLAVYAFIKSLHRPNGGGGGGPCNRTSATSRSALVRCEARWQWSGGWGGCGLSVRGRW